MAIVAASALALGAAVELKRRPSHLLAIARGHAVARDHARWAAVEYAFTRPLTYARRQDAVAEWHDGLVRKYEAAARRPWWPVFADPSPPDP